MYANNIRPSVKCEIQTERSAEHKDQIARPRRAQIRKLRVKRAMRIYSRSGQILYSVFGIQLKRNLKEPL